MTEPEFNATGVRIERWLRSLTRAGQVLIRDGRLELLTSRGLEIDSAPLESVRTKKPWFTHADRALATVNGTRYLLTLGPPTARRFLHAVHEAHDHGSRADQH